MELLFITDRYWGDDPQKGETNFISNVIRSFESTNFGTYKIYYISSLPGDIQSTKDIDYILLNETYDLAFVNPVGTKWNTLLKFENLPSHQFPPQITVSPEVAKKLGNKLVMAWWDSILHHDQSEIKEYSQYCPQLTMDTGYGEESYNIIGLSTPQDPLIFCPNPEIEKTIPVSFTGRTSVMGRIETLNSISKIQIQGGRDKDNLPVEEYANFFKRSKININLQENNGIPQRKGRAFEIAACGGFMLSNYPEMLAGKEGFMFEPGKEFIILDPNNINDQIDFWLENDSKREEIAFNLNEKYNKVFSPKPWWENFFKLIKL